MKKKSILLIIIACIVVGIIGTFSYKSLHKSYVASSKSKNNKENVKLVIDSENKDILPKHFRMSNKAIESGKAGSANLTGLANLNISGSGAVSEKSLALVKQTIGNKHMIDVDLRQESHGFVNGMGISWFGKKNEANVRLTRNQVIQDENNKLNKISEEKYVKFDKIPKGKAINSISYIKNPQKVESEEQLAESLGISYLRITVTDHEKPLDDQVDLFIESVRNLPQSTWLHFHCRGGAGRTTTFMAMYDMMHNAKNVSFEDIMKRQVLIGGSDLLNGVDENRKSKSESRAEFLKKFYEYCRNNNDGFKISWSQWSKE